MRARGAVSFPVHGRHLRQGWLLCYSETKGVDEDEKFRFLELGELRHLPNPHTIVGARLGPLLMLCMKLVIFLGFDPFGDPRRGRLMAGIANVTTATR